jgi:hypothetical protein
VIVDLLKTGRGRSCYSPLAGNRSGEHDSDGRAGRNGGEPAARQIRQWRLRLSVLGHGGQSAIAGSVIAGSHPDVRRKCSPFVPSKGRASVIRDKAHLV